MGKLYQFPRDFTAAVVVAYVYEQRFFFAQFKGSLCPHYHTFRHTAERCHRGLARSFRSMRAAQ